MKNLHRQDEVLLNQDMQLAAFRASNGSVLLGPKSYKKVASEPSAASVTFGSNYIRLKVDRQGQDEWLNDARIYIAISAITGSAGTYIRGVNGLGLFLFEGWRLFVDSKEKEYATSAQVFEHLYKNVTSDKWARIAKDIGYDTSTSNRNTLAGAAQYFAVPLKWLFNFFAKPVDITAYADIEIRCYLKTSVRHCIQTDKTSPTLTFNQFYLDCEYVKPIDSITQMHRDMIKSGKSPIVFDYEYIDRDFPIASGSTSASLDLPELNDKNIIDIAVELKPAANINTNDTSDYTDSNTAITTFNIKSGNKYLNNLEQDLTVSTEYQRLILPRYHLKGIKQVVDRTNPAVIISFAHDYENSDVEKQQKFHGYKSFENIRDAKINLTFSSLGSNHIASVRVRCAKLLVNNLGLLQNH